MSLRVFFANIIFRPFLLFFRPLFRRFKQEVSLTSSSGHVSPLGKRKGGGVASPCACILLFHHCFPVVRPNDGLCGFLRMAQPLPIPETAEGFLVLFLESMSIYMVEFLKRIASHRGGFYAFLKKKHQILWSNGCPYKRHQGRWEY